MLALTTITPTAQWRDYALCRGIDPGIFHPETEEDDEHASDAARAVCFQCPVREACLEHAISVRDSNNRRYRMKVPSEADARAILTNIPA